MMNSPPPEVIESLRYFLREDIRSGDLTTKILGTHDKPGVGTIFAKSRSVLAGMEEVIAIAKLTGLSHEVLEFEGNWVGPKQPVLRLQGPAKTLLQVERLCLNLIMRMSGVATKAYNMVQAAREKSSHIRVAATRKTTPGFRYFEKRAVQVGGADPHRYALDDMVLIKNNHISVIGSVEDAIRAAKESVSFTKKISCEVRSLQEAVAAAQVGADIILLDNFTPKEAAKAHKALVDLGIRDRVILEASGGIDEDNVRDFAESGVDVLSSGALTHSYMAADYNMLVSLL